MRLPHRIRAAVRVLIRGEGRAGRKTPIPTISREEVEDFHRFFPRKKFFVFGHARSGTTLLMRLLRLHAEVHCDYQAHFFTRRPLLKSLVDSSEAEEWLSRKSNRWNHGRDLSPIVLRAAAEYIMERDASRLGKSIVGDKSPTSGIHGQAVRDLHALFPDARLIYIVRDGRDVAISERFRNFVEDSRFLSRSDRRIRDQLQKRPESFGEGRESLFTEEMLRRVARGWAADIAEVDTEGRKLFGRHYLSVRYEDLLAHPDKELERLWRFLGTRSIPRTLAKQVRAEMQSNPDQEWQSNRGQELSALLVKGKSGNWRSFFTQRDREVFKHATGDALQQWDYERTAEW
jgi:hypothetical protein